MMAGKFESEELEFPKPTNQEMQDGLARVLQHLPGWKARPAFYTENPGVGLIVTAQDFNYDDELFSLKLRVEEVLVGRQFYKAGDTFSVSCAWNAPYISCQADSLSAPYNFYLTFATRAVENIHRFLATLPTQAEEEIAPILGTLSYAFGADELDLEWQGTNSSEFKIGTRG